MTQTTERKEPEEANPLKAKLGAGRAVVGTWSIVPSPVMSEICAVAGLDFIILDLEHGVFDLPTLESCVRASEAQGCSPLVRIPRAGDPVLQNVLDLGAHGIVVPQIPDFATAEAAVRALKFPPEGTRGYNPFTRSGEYRGGVGAKAPKLENDFAFNTLLIETQGALRDLDRIVALPGLDALYLGIYDMSLALGHRGNLEHPEMLRFLEGSITSIREAGLVAGALFKTPEELKRLVGLGANLLVYCVDTWVYRGAMEVAARMLEPLRARPL